MHDALESVQQVLQLLSFLRTTLAQYLDRFDGDGECSGLALALRWVLVFTGVVAATGAVELRWDFPVFAQGPADLLGFGLRYEASQCCVAVVERRAITFLYQST